MKQWFTDSASCLDSGCAVGMLPAGFDQVDQLIWELQEFVGFTNSLMAEDPEWLATTIDQWLPQLYEPDEVEKDNNGNVVRVIPRRDDWFDRMYNHFDDKGQQIGWFALLNSWQSQLETIRTQFPLCSASAPPCKRWNGADWVYTVDNDPGGDFSKLLERFQQFRQEILRFRTALETFYNEVTVLDVELGAGWGGGGRRIEYEWEDARGKHAVRVQVSGFRIPHLRNKANSMESCVLIEDGHDYQGENPTWVRISRSDPPAVFGSLFTWQTKNAVVDPCNTDDNDEDPGWSLSLNGLTKRSVARWGRNPYWSPNLPAGVKQYAKPYFVKLKPRQPDDPACANKK